MKQLFLLLLLFPLITQGQVNGFAKVTNISGNVLTLSNVNQSFGSFAAGQQVIIIQMQGASISQTANVSGFGTLASLNSAGLYEIATVSAVNGAVTSITLSAALTNSYNTAGSIQVLTFPQLGSGAFTTTAAINATAWNGTIGGIIAFKVNGNLNLYHNINASFSGFRAGNAAQNDGSACETATYITASGNAKYADKGEGIYITASSEKAGRAKAVNGGGGGIVHNGGGGGGGNYTAGGDGYYGYTASGYCSSTLSAGGQGGLAVSSSGMRVFMGGGGGGAQGNNSVASAGGAGGGIVMINCDTIVVANGCAAVSIRANGEPGPNSGGNDGAGGGGAGGTVVLAVKGIRVQSGCPLTIAANGGNGGDVDNSSPHGAGGGGGQGALFISASGPFANTSLTANNGTGGSANTGGSSPLAGSGSGSSGSGVNTGVSPMALPVDLLSFEAQAINSKLVEISWLTLHEKNNREFEVYHTYNGADWRLIGSRKGRGNHFGKAEYRLDHRNPQPGMNYYKLKQVDEDGTYSYSNIIYLALEDQPVSLHAFPNPGNGEFILETNEDLSGENFRVLNATTHQLNVRPVPVSPGKYRLDLTGYPPGLYFVYSQNTSVKLILK